VAEVRPQHALPLESDLLGHALGREVVRIRDQVDALELEVLECMTHERRSALVQIPRPRAPRATQ
jgi:hypothetical protein